MARVFADVGALAVAVFGGGQHALGVAVGRGSVEGVWRGRHFFAGIGHQQGDDALAFVNIHAAHAPGIAAHGAHIVFVKAHGLATVAEQHHIVLAVGQRRANQVVAFVQADGDDAHLARVGKFGQRRFLHRAHAGGHEDVVVFREVAHLAGQRQHHVDFFAFLQREHVHDGPPARVARTGGHFPHLEPVQPPPVGEAQNPVVRVGDKELVNPVVFFGCRGLLAAPATLLRAVFAQRLALDVAGVAKGDHHVGGRDQVFGREVLRTVLDGGAARAQLGLAKLGFQRSQLIADDGGDTPRLGQDVQQVFNDRHDVFVFGDDFVLLQAGQALQAHLQNLLRLGVRQAVQTIVLHAQFCFQAFRAVIVSIDHAAIRVGAGQHLAHQLAVPTPVHQLGFGHRGRGGIANDGDEVVNIGQRHRQAFQHMATLAGFAQLKHGAAGDHFAAMLQENGDQVLQIAQAWLAVDQGHHVHAEGVLQLRLFVQIVQHHFGHFAALELNHQAHTGFVRFVLDVADAFELFLVHQLGHALLQRFFIHLVGQLIDDDGLALAPVNVLEVHLGPHHHAATAGAVAVLDTLNTVNDPGGREVWGGNDFHQLVNRCLWRVQQVQASIDHFIQVVRRNVGGHPHRNTRAAIDQQAGQAGGQHQGLVFAAVVVGAKVHGLFVDVGQHFVGNFRQANFRVTHRCRVITIDRAEVALAIDQHVAQRKILRHAHDGVVHRYVAVRVVFTNHVTDDTCRLFVRAIPIVVQLVHGKQHPPMHRF